MKRNTNPLCQTCQLARNNINGRYCSKIQRYVEHDTTPACGITE